MIYKTFSSFGGQDAHVLDISSNGMSKLASMDTHIPESLIPHIERIEANPDPRFAYLYDRALGAGEVYGPNNNGDWFGRDELREHHDTFVKMAHLFRHHQNKDPRNAIGSVLASAYNEPLDVVDLIVQAPIEKIAADLDRYKKGGLIQTSMGAKVQHDVCSICGSTASTRLAYCEHLRNMMLKVMPDGRQVYAINPKPKFVDISIVIIPADPSSTILRKVASQFGGLDLSKVSEIKKNDVGNIDEPSPEECRPVIRPEVINAAGKIGDQGKAIKTLEKAYGPLRPDEFQSILRKDASFLRPEIVPYITSRSAPHLFIRGESSDGLADIFTKIAGTPLSKMAKLVRADFLSREEEDMYLGYRQASKSKAYLR